MFGRRGLRDQLPVFQPQYTVGDFGHGLAIGDDDAGDGEGAEHGTDLGFAFGIYMGGALIEDDDAGRAVEGAGEEDALFLAAGPGGAHVTDQ